MRHEHRRPLGPRRRRRTFWLNGRRLANTTALLCLVTLLYALFRSPAMVVRRVVVTMDGQVVDHERRQTRDVALLPAGTQLLTLDWSSPLRRLESLPWVRHAAMRREPWTRTIVFAIRLRKPVLTVASGSRHWEVDKEGFVIRPLRRGAILPRLSLAREARLSAGQVATDEHVQAGLAAFLLMPAVKDLRATQINVDQTGAICFNNWDRVVVVVGSPANLPHKMAAVEWVYSAMPDVGRTYSKINVCCPQYPAGTPHKKRDSENGKQPPT